MNSNLIIKFNNDSVLLFLEWMGIYLSINKRAFTIGMKRIKNDLHQIIKKITISILVYM